MLFGRCLTLGIYPLPHSLGRSLALFLPSLYPGLCGHRFHGRKTDAEKINQPAFLTDMRSACGNSLQTQTLELDVQPWDLRAYLDLAKISDSVNMNSHGLCFAAYVPLMQTQWFINDWKEKYVLQHPPPSAAWVVSKWGFPPDRLADLSLSCGEVTAPCWPWFPLSNRGWWYFTL